MCTCTLEENTLSLDIVEVQRRYVYIRDKQQFDSVINEVECPEFVCSLYCVLLS